MASFSSTYPSQRPVFSLDAANAGRLDPRMTFTRSDTPPTYAAPSAVHFWSNEKHLSSYNAFTKSEGLSNWTLNNVTPTANAVVAPDGNTTGDTITGDAGTSQKYVQSNTAYDDNPVISVYAKAGTHNFIQIITNYSTGHYANFDLTSGAGAVGDVGAATTASIQAVGSTGWYRCIARFTVTNSSYVGRVVLVDSATSARFASSATTGTVHLWGAMANNQGDLTNIVAYQPSTGQIHREYAPTLKSVATAGQPRFEYDPSADGQSMGCLIEGQSTNLATYGSDLTNAAWNPLSAFIGGTAVGPDGTLSAVKLVASAGSSLYPRFRRLSFLTSTTQTFSIYVKPLEFQHLAISADGSASCLVQYNLSGSGAITSSTGATGTVEQCGNGWFRVSFSYTTVPNAHLAITMQSSTTYQAETGNGYDGMLFALAQLENQSFASSFIGTTSSTATRAAESLSVVSSDLFDNGGGSLVVETENVGRAYYAAVLEDDSTSVYQDYVALTVRADNKARQTVNAPGSTGASDEFSAASTVGGSYFKIASRFAPNDFGVCIDGGTVSTDTTGAVPSNVDKLFIGWYDDGGRANAHIKRVALYGEALSDANLVSLTS